MRLFILATALICSSLVQAHNLGSSMKFASTLKGSIYSKDYHQTMETLTHMGIEVAGVDYNEKIIDVLINDAEFELLSQKGIEVEINWVSGLWSDALLDEEYKNPAEIEAFVKTYHEKYPELTQLVSIGKSIEGRDIWALKISDNAAKREIDESTILFNSMHHAREVMTPEVSIDIIEYLLTNYARDSKVTDWVNSYEIWVVPMLNVDGNNKVWNNNTMWRKNTRGGFGVDLNRNYPFNWNTCRGSSGSTYSDTYRGTEPGSEPETQALMNLVRTIKPVFDISYHSYSELVLYPFGCRNSGNQATAVVESIGAEIGDLLDYTAGTPWELLYNADGGDIDWMYGSQQVIPYVIELNSRSSGFQPNYKRMRDVTVERNRAGWQLLLEKMQGSGVKGRLAVNTKEDSSIEVYNQAGKLFQTYRINPDGTFHIVLMPGEYTLKLKGKKFFEKTVEIKESLINLGKI